jgi:hypothetical protein
MGQTLASDADVPAQRAWWCASIMSTAVTMSAAVAHLMEMPAKMRYERELYVRLHRTLYPTFGKTAGPAEAMAVASAAALAWKTHGERRRSSGLTAVAAACLAGAHGIFWTVVQPANAEMVRWPLDEIPRNWARWRNRWEYGHAVRAGLVTAGLAALTWSALSVAADAAE